MTDQVQHLIDRIRKDAVQTAEQQSQDLLIKARAQAEAIVAEARAKATATTHQAERERQQLIERGTQSLTQAARDLLLDIGDRLLHMVEKLLATASTAALSPAVIEQMLLRLAEGFAENGVAEGQIDVIVSAADRERLLAFAMQQLRGKLEQGVQVSADQRLARGFRLSFANGSVQHDFSSDAIATSLARRLRPQMADIVMAAALGTASAGAPPVTRPPARPHDVNTGRP